MGVIKRTNPSGTTCWGIQWFDESGKRRREFCVPLGEHVLDEHLRARHDTRDPTRCDLPGGRGSAERGDYGSGCAIDGKRGSMDGQGSRVAGVAADRARRSEKSG